MHLIVGLGNPGKEYERTRHNVGFIIIHALAHEFGFPASKFDKKMNAEVSKGEINGKRVLLAEPQTFMNNSGQAVHALLSYHKLTPADLIVIHDEKDVLLGETRVQKDRGSAGHNGVQSIVDTLGTKDFLRIRVGVAPAEKPIVDTAGFVLGKFTKEEQKALNDVIVHVIQEIKNIVGK